MLEFAAVRAPEEKTEFTTATFSSTVSKLIYHSTVLVGDIKPRPDPGLGRGVT